jgi:hypothetical protein
MARQYAKKSLIHFSLVLIFLYSTTMILLTNSSRLYDSNYALAFLPNPSNSTPPPPRHNPSPQLSSTSGFLNYENPDFGIKIQYPSDWVKNDRVDSGRLSTTIVSFGLTSDGITSVDILQGNLGKEGVSLQQLLNKWIHSYSKLENFKILEANTESNLGNHKAYVLRYTSGHSDAVLEVRDITTIVGDKSYTVVYYAPKQDYFTYLPTVNKMVDSFEVQ